jgi:hypothetical protein
MSDDKTRNRKGNVQKPIKMFRVGAIAASVWKRQTSTGFEYLDFSLSRSWKLKSGEKEGYSTSFFHNNEDALLDVVEQASEFIRENSIPENQAKSAESTTQATDHVVAQP